MLTDHSCNCEAETAKAMETAGVAGECERGRGAFSNHWRGLGTPLHAYNNGRRSWAIIFIPSVHHRPTHSSRARRP